MIVLAGLLALICALILAPVFQYFGPRIQAIDMPCDRKRHKFPIARVGGLAIICSIVIPLLLFSDQLTPALKGLLAGGFIVFILGFFDDVYDIPYYVKLPIQLCAVILFLVVSNCQPTPLTFFGVTANLGYLYYPIIIIWIIGVMNAFNLIDGLDALAGGVSIFIFATFAYLFYSSGQYEELMFTTILLGAILGFLRNNIPPARIFLGDSGALFLGFIMGALGIAYSFRNGNPPSFTIPVLVVFLPVLDTLYVIGHRIVQRKNPFLPDRRHLHHILLELGIQEFHVVLIIYVMTISFCVLAIISQYLSSLSLAVLFVILSFLSIVFPRLYPIIRGSILGTIFRTLYIKPADFLLHPLEPTKRKTHRWEMKKSPHDMPLE